MASKDWKGFNKEDYINSAKQLDLLSKIKRFGKRKLFFLRRINKKKKQTIDFNSQKGKQGTQRSSGRFNESKEK